MARAEDLPRSDRVRFGGTRDQSPLNDCRAHDRHRVQLQEAWAGALEGVGSGVLETQVSYPEGNMATSFGRKNQLASRRACACRSCSLPAKARL